MSAPRKLVTHSTTILFIYLLFEYIRQIGIALFTNRYKVGSTERVWNKKDSMYLLTRATTYIDCEDEYKSVCGTTLNKFDTPTECKKLLNFMSGICVQSNYQSLADGEDTNLPLKVISKSGTETMFVYRQTNQGIDGGQNSPIILRPNPISHEKESQGRSYSVDKARKTNMEYWSKRFVNFFAEPFANAGSNYLLAAYAVVIVAAAIASPGGKALNIIKKGSA